MQLQKRKRNRLRNFDYSSPGAYFITICTEKRQPILSNIVGAIHESPEIRLTQQGKIVDEVINDIPIHMGVEIQNYVIMPNHIHLIVLITECNYLRAIRESPLRSRSIISRVVGFLKMNVSKRIHREIGEGKIFQRSFHDHVIRGQKDYDRISEYIDKNPLYWQYDCFYNLNQ